MNYVGIGKTDMGNVRTNNEDSFFVSNSNVNALPNLYIIADGMGGHNAGEVASSESIKFFTEFVSSNSCTMEIQDFLADATQYANKKVYDLSCQDISLDGMGTTFTACVIDEDSLLFAHVGDSRIYIVNDTIHQISEDHTFVNVMVKSGQLTAEEARTHPNRNMVTRALGTDDDLAVDRGRLTLNVNDSVLICSDGLSNMVSDEEILEIMKNNSTGKAEALINRAKDNGGIDNISVVVIG